MSLASFCNIIDQVKLRFGEMNGESFRSRLNQDDETGIKGVASNFGFIDDDKSGFNEYDCKPLNVK